MAFSTFLHDPIQSVLHEKNGLSSDMLSVMDAQAIDVEGLVNHLDKMLQSAIKGRRAWREGEEGTPDNIEADLGRLSELAVIHIVTRWGHLLPPSLVRAPADEIDAVIHLDAAISGLASYLLENENEANRARWTAAYNEGRLDLIAEFDRLRRAVLNDRGWQTHRQPNEKLSNLETVLLDIRVETALSVEMAAHLGAENVRSQADNLDVQSFPGASKKSDAPGSQ